LSPHRSPELTAEALSPARAGKEKDEETSVRQNKYANLIAPASKYIKNIMQDLRSRLHRTAIR